MYSMLLPVHLAFAGIWLGCVLTETLFERALLGKGREQEMILVDLHKRVDLIVEIPAFTVVLLTGIMLLPDAGKNGLLLLKIILGVIAIITNIYCVLLVFRRARAAHAGQWGEFTHLDHRQHIYGAIVLLTVIASLAIGSYTYAYT